MSIDTCSISPTCARSSIITDSYATPNDLKSIEFETSSNRSDFLVNDETTIKSMCESIDSGSQTILSSSRLNGATDRDSDKDSVYAKSLKKISFIMGP